MDTYTCQICGKTVKIIEQPTHLTEECGKEDLYRVTYTTSGMKRRTKTVTKADLDFLRSAGYLGIRVTSDRRATESEAAKGALRGSFNV